EKENLSQIRRNQTGFPADKLALVANERVIGGRPKVEMAETEGAFQAVDARQRRFASRDSPGDRLPVGAPAGRLHRMAAALELFQRGAGGGVPDPNLAFGVASDCELAVSRKSARNRAIFVSVVANERFARRQIKDFASQGRRRIAAIRIKQSLGIGREF